MIFKTHIKPSRGIVDAAPMVDVVFLLLIFFILSSSFVMQPGIKVVLPPSEVKTPGEFQGMVVTVTRAEAIYFNNELTSMGELQSFLAEAVAQGNSPQELVIKADEQVPHGMVVKIMTLAIEAGIPSINIATRPEVPPTGAP